MFVKLDPANSQHWSLFPFLVALLRSEIVTWLVVDLLVVVQLRRIIVRRRYAGVIKEIIFLVAGVVDATRELVFLVAVRELVFLVAARKLVFLVAFKRLH